MRVSASSDFEAIHDSAEWRTYLALQATFMSLPDGHLRDTAVYSILDVEWAVVRRNLDHRLEHGGAR